ncbi:MAG: tetratricopeptide repeat protein [Candidatus Absconditabacteria bacterium]
MIKFGVSSWIILSAILLVFPIGFLLYFLYTFAAKYVLQFFGSLRDKKMMYKIKEELVDSNIIEEELHEFHEEEEDLSEEELLSVPFNDSGNDLLEKADVDDVFDTPAVEEDSYEDKELVKKKKKDIEKIVYQALVLRKEGKLDDYEKKIIEGLAIDSEDRDLNKLLADYYFNLGNYKKALSLLKKIVELDPTDHKAIWQIGEMYLISGDFETAELLVDKAISLNQSNPKYYISLVEILYNTERKVEAVDVMEKVVKLRPTNTVYLLTLADLYFEIQNFDIAKKNYFRVLEYEPTNEKAKSKLKSLT